MDLADVANAVWGTGHGSRRHLVDHQRSRRDPRTGWHVLARCNTYLLLDFLDSVTRPTPYANRTPRELVARRKPCTRCYGIAATESIPVDLPERTP